MFLSFHRLFCSAVIFSVQVCGALDQSSEVVGCRVQEDNNQGGPLVPCSFLPDEFVVCDSLQLISTAVSSDVNFTQPSVGYCNRFGGQRTEEVEWTNTMCHVIDCSIECRGERAFLREVPCIKYTGHHFLSTLLYSVLLGVVAVDRFCLGYSAIAVGKLMTLGGLGIWWIIDVCLLVTGNLTPADDSNWERFY